MHERKEGEVEVVVVGGGDLRDPPATSWLQTSAGSTLTSSASARSAADGHRRAKEDAEEGPGRRKRGRRPRGPRPLQTPWRPQADAHVAVSITRPWVSASCQTPPLPQAEAGDGDSDSASWRA